MTNLSPLEKQEQADFIAYCENTGLRVVSTQNGFTAPYKGMNKFAYINSLKRAGLSPGFPDLIIFAKNSKHNLLFIEMKRQKGSRVSAEQKEWLHWLTDNGYYTAIAYGCAHAKEILKKYLEM